jgi:UDP:flavonoid glycosyltransferase YjiC (YdhE family)
VQGFAVQLSPHQAGTPAFREALMEVLTDPKYTKAAQAMSKKIRARKNTPVQEAAGVLPTLSSSARSQIAFG